MEIFIISRDKNKSWCNFIMLRLTGSIWRHRQQTTDAEMDPNTVICLQFDSFATKKYTFSVAPSHQTLSDSICLTQKH